MAAEAARAAEAEAEGRGRGRGVRHASGRSNNTRARRSRHLCTLFSALRPLSDSTRAPDRPAAIRRHIGERRRPPPRAGQRSLNNIPRPAPISRTSARRTPTVALVTLCLMFLRGWVVPPYRPRDSLSGQSGTPKVARSPGRGVRAGLHPVDSRLAPVSIIQLGGSGPHPATAVLTVTPPRRRPARPVCTPSRARPAVLERRARPSSVPCTSVVFAPWTGGGGGWRGQNGRRSTGGGGAAATGSLVTSPTQRSRSSYGPGDCSGGLQAAGVPIGRAQLMDQELMQSSEQIWTLLESYGIISRRVSSPAAGHRLNITLWMFTQFGAMEVLGRNTDD